MPGWSDLSAPHIAKPGRVFHFTADGWFTTGAPLYVHYFKDGAEQYATKVGVLQSPCGHLTTTMTEFPFTPVPAGLLDADAWRSSPPS